MRPCVKNSLQIRPRASILRRDRRPCPPTASARTSWSVRRSGTPACAAPCSSPRTRRSPRGCRRRMPGARPAGGANDHSSASSSPSRHVEDEPRVRDRRLDLRAVADDAGVAPSAARRRPRRTRRRPPGSNPANTSRNRGRLRRIVIHDSPAWKPSRLSFSKSARSPCSGTPHSSSWYRRYSGSSPTHAHRATPSGPRITLTLVTLPAATRRAQRPGYFFLSDFSDTGASPEAASAA